MKKEIIVTENAPGAFGPFCQAMKAKGFIFTSGILPLDPSTGKKVEGGIEKETRQTLDNIKGILDQYFSEPYPARAAIEVSGLAKDAKVEIQATGICDE